MFRHEGYLEEPYMNNQTYVNNQIPRISQRDFDYSNDRVQIHRDHTCHSI